MEVIQNRYLSNISLTRISNDSLIGFIVTLMTDTHYCQSQSGQSESYHTKANCQDNLAKVNPAKATLPNLLKPLTMPKPILPMHFWLYWAKALTLVAFQPTLRSSLKACTAMLLLQTHVSQLVYTPSLFPRRILPISLINTYLPSLHGISYTTRFWFFFWGKVTFTH